MKWVLIWKHASTVTLAVLCTLLWCEFVTETCVTTRAKSARIGARGRDDDWADVISWLEQKLTWFTPRSSAGTIWFHSSAEGRTEGWFGPGWQSTNWVGGERGLVCCLLADLYAAMFLLLVATSPTHMTSHMTSHVTSRQFKSSSCKSTDVSINKSHDHFRYVELSANGGTWAAAMMTAAWGSVMLLRGALVLFFQDLNQNTSRQNKTRSHAWRESCPAYSVLTACSPAAHNP